MKCNAIIIVHIVDALLNIFQQMLDFVVAVSFSQLRYFTEIFIYRINICTMNDQQASNIFATYE